MYLSNMAVVLYTITTTISTICSLCDVAGWRENTSAVLLVCADERVVLSVTLITEIIINHIC